MNNRHPNDGQPYYCAVCGLGLGEFLACELPDCKLESADVALRRHFAAIRQHTRAALTGEKAGERPKRLR